MKRGRGRPKGSRDKKPRVRSSSVLQSRQGTHRAEQQSDIVESRPKKKSTKVKEVHSDRFNEGQSLKSEGMSEAEFGQMG